MTMLLSPVSKSKSGAWKKKRIYRSFILFFLKYYTIYFPILSVMQASFSRVSRNHVQALHLRLLASIISNTNTYEYGGKNIARDLN